MMKITKKGQFMQSQFGKWILFAVSAAILIVAIGHFSPLYGEIAEKEACRSSVVLRSTQIAQLAIPLNCKTKEVTITSIDENKIKSEIAREMYDCWDMLGQGKIDFFGESAWKIVSLGTAQSSCIICSRIKFDENVQKKISGVDIDNYLASANVPGKDFTYLEYFSGEKTKLPTDVQIMPLSTGQEYAVIFSGIKGGDFGSVLKTDIALLGVGVAGSMATIGSYATGKLILTAGKATMQNPWAALATITAAVGTQMGFAAWNQHVSAMYCDGSKQGCFILSIIPYSAEAISAKCQNIESIS